MLLKLIETLLVFVGAAFGWILAGLTKDRSLAPYIFFVVAFLGVILALALHLIWAV